MTVSSLIETLRGLDPNATVVVKNRHGTETDDVQVYTAIDGKYANRPTSRIVCICEEDRLRLPTFDVESMSKPTS